MKKYKVYGGLGSCFGGNKFVGFFICDSQQEAKEIGRKFAMAIYQDFEGLYSMMTRENCKTKMEMLGLDTSEEKVNEYYKQTIELWLDYTATEV